jgi:uncharacterized protein YraI
VLLALVASAALVVNPKTAHADTGFNWTGNYFNNRDLVGLPAVTRVDPVLVFNWGPYSPVPGIASTNWSARWTTVQYLNAGTYRFTITADDGVRAYVDGQIILDQWHDEVATTYNVDVQVASGNHILQVDYYQGNGDSSLSVTWNLLQSASTSWLAQYYNNPNLIGAPVLTRYENQIDYNWGYGSPDPLIPTVYFSARWTATVPFNAGTYRFNLSGDDGVRLYIDNILVIDQWHGESLTLYSIDVALSSGLHTLRVEYFQNTERAEVHFAYSLAVGPPPYPGSDTDRWFGEYYSNPNLTGSPAYTHDDGTGAINFQIGNDWPAPGFQHDSFSVRWTRQTCFPGQPYSFTVTADDGVRFYIDTTLVIDAWKVQSPTTYTKSVDLTQGCHLLRLEYFQDHLGGQILLTWNPPNGQIPPYGGGAGTSPSGVYASVNTYALNVRTGPGTSFDILTQVLRGTTFSVIARNADNSWVQIMDNGIGVAWVSAFYVTFNGNVAGLPVANGPTGTGNATGVRGQAYATVRVRSGPGFNFGQIDTLDWQTIVDIVGRDSTGSWLQIRNGSEIGWVYGAYIVVISGDISNVPITG